MMRKIGGDKRGQSLTLGTIILIVLGVAVLVFLIWGFSQGWSNLWSKITAYTGGGDNADDIKAGCNLACAGNRVSEYCEGAKTLKKGGKETPGTCDSFKAELSMTCSIPCS